MYIVRNNEINSIDPKIIKSQYKLQTVKSIFRLLENKRNEL
jgi:hypothetical protein